MTRKELNQRIKKAHESEDKELVSMLEDYLHLKYHWIPQVKKRFLGPDAGGLYTPHRCVLRDDVVIEWYNKIKEK